MCKLSTVDHGPFVLSSQLHQTCNMQQKWIKPNRTYSFSNIWSPSSEYTSLRKTSLLVEVVLVLLFGFTKKSLCSFSLFSRKFCSLSSSSLLSYPLSSWLTRKRTFSASKLGSSICWWASRSSSSESPPFVSSGSQLQQFWSRKYLRFLPRYLLIRTIDRFVKLHGQMSRHLRFRFRFIISFRSVSLRCTGCLLRSDSNAGLVFLVSVEAAAFRDT